MTRRRRSAEPVHGHLPRQPLVVHIAESFASGVLTAVSEYISACPDYRHVVLGSLRPGLEADVSIPGADRVVLLAPGYSQQARVTFMALRQLRPDIVHSHSSISGVYARLAARSLAIPTVHSPHCFGFLRQDIPRMTVTGIRIAERVLSRITDVYLTAGPAETAHVRSLKSTAQVFEAYPSLGRSPETVEVVTKDIDLITAGRIAPQKAPRDFAAIVDRLRAAGWRGRAVWVGDGTELDRAVLERATVEVTGWLSHEKTLSLMERARIYLHTARWEAGIAYSIIEAGSLSLPVIARDTPESRDRIGCVLFSTPEEAAHAIERLTRDTGEYRKAAANAATMAEPSWTIRRSESIHFAYAAALSGAGSDASTRGRP